MCIRDRLSSHRLYLHTFSQINGQSHFVCSRLSSMYLPFSSFPVFALHCPVSYTHLVISMIISIFETLAQYSPIYLTNQNLALLTKSVSLTDFIPSIGLTVIIIIINIFLSMSIFNKKQL